jgi:hypothetical protein
MAMGIDVDIKQPSEHDHESFIPNYPLISSIEYQLARMQTQLDELSAKAPGFERRGHSK